jgi:hypothetical protein
LEKKTCGRKKKKEEINGGMGSSVMILALKMAAKV